MENKCETCKHWRRDYIHLVGKAEYPDHGVCSKSPEFSPFAFVPHKDFGCRLWEAAGEDWILASYTNLESGESWRMLSGSLWEALKSGTAKGIALTLDSENCERALVQVPKPEDI